MPNTYDPKLVAELIEAAERVAYGYEIYDDTLVRGYNDRILVLRMTLSRVTSEPCPTCGQPRENQDG